MRPERASAELRGVVELAKSARDTVGFLTDAAFDDRARRGSLIAALNDGDVIGYALYDLPRDELRIVQLVVADAWRGHGVARELVDRIARDHSERRGIFLHCRNDFPADKLWPKLDFVPLGERPGRSFEGLPLTRWYRSFGQPDLFTLLHEDDRRPVAVLDACVFFDIVSDEPKPVSRQLQADWIGEHARLAVTDHLLHEIHKGKNTAERRRHAGIADSFRLPTTPTSASDWRAAREELEVAHPNAPASDEDDLVHLAQALTHEATWLVTADRAFARKYGRTASELGGLQIIAPAAFLRQLDEQAQVDRYRPLDLAGTSVMRREADAATLPDLGDLFVNHEAGERIRDLRRVIDALAADPSRVHLEVIEVDQAPRGLVCWQVEADALNVRLARVKGGPGATTIGRQLLGLVRDHSVRSGLQTIRITDASPSASVQRSFRDEGFAIESDTPIAHAVQGIGTMDRLLENLESLDALPGPFSPDAELRATVRGAAEAERWFAPFRVLDAGIPTFVIPIQHGWATDLLDVGLAQEQLLPRPWGLGLRRELVYYRSPRNAGGISAPARLLWYVSGSAPGAGTIRATSQLSEVVVDNYERLFYRFQSLGVYTLEDVAERADARGHAMALRFGATLRFDRPVTLDQYRELVAGDPKSKQVVLRSVRPLSEHMFVRVLEIGMT